MHLDQLNRELAANLFGPATSPALSKVSAASVEQDFGDITGMRAVLIYGQSFLLLLESISTSAYAQLTKVNIASSGISPTQLPPYMAQDTGIYSKNGLEVTIVRTRPEIAVMSLLGAEASIIHIGGALAIRSNL